MELSINLIKFTLVKWLIDKYFHYVNESSLKLMTYLILIKGFLVTGSFVAIKYITEPMLGDTICFDSLHGEAVDCLGHHRLSNCRSADLTARHPNINYIIRRAFVLPACQLF